jgi:hypothetical protein
LKEILRHQSLRKINKSVFAGGGGFANDRSYMSVDYKIRQPPTPMVTSCAQARQNLNSAHFSGADTRKQAPETFFPKVDSCERVKRSKDVFWLQGDATKCTWNIFVMSPKLR